MNNTILESVKYQHSAIVLYVFYYAAKTKFAPLQNWG